MPTPSPTPTCTPASTPAAARAVPAPPQPALATPEMALRQRQQAARSRLGAAPAGPVAQIYDDLLHVAGALAWLEVAAPGRTGTLLLREQFDTFRTRGGSPQQWTQLRAAADSLVRTWNPFLHGEQPDPLAALLYARLS